MNDPASVLNALFVFLLGLVCGGFAGWQIRMIYEVRETTRKAASLLAEATKLEHGEHNTRVPRTDDGRVEVSTIFFVLLFVFALLSSVFGVVVATRAEARTLCYTQVNEEFANAIEIRSMDAGSLEREARQIDREALDALIGIVADNINARQNGAEEQSLMGPFAQYRAEREAAEALRDQAEQVRDENPYPSSARCR